jgi:hypothetical protein
MNITLTYSLLIPVPIVFVIYVLVRFVRHWKDGKCRKGSFSKYQICKYFLTISQVCVNLSIIFLGIHIKAKETDAKELERVILIYYSISCMGWILSCALCYFEYVRQLKMEWLGHRSYWPACFIINVFFVIILSVDEEESENTNEMILYSFKSAINLLLLLLAFFKPNDYQVELYRGGSTNEVYNIISDGENKFIFSFHSESHLPLLTIQIINYKIKPDFNKNTIYYTIFTKYLDLSFTSKRSYIEFHFLNVNLRSKLPNGKTITFPNFPVFMSNHIPIDKKMQELSVYLSELSKLDLIDEELLEFLNIEGKPREDILSELEKRSRKTMTSTEFQMFS